ncbi:MAG TPA: hypothetical protein VHZ32_18730 [Rhizomicrobium sp.]|jgi:hypothetical protein|nr:hypothetical protein [Rhizomicrobium sp.]
MNRRDIIAGIAAAGIALAAGVYHFTGLFVKHYPPTPYDDLLSKLTDREQAAKLGAKVTAFDLQRRVAQLRASLQNRSLTTAANADIAAGRMAEVEGWILPLTLVSLSALAAKA